MLNATENYEGPVIRKRTGEDGVERVRLNEKKEIIAERSDEPNSDPNSDKSIRIDNVISFKSRKEDNKKLKEIRENLDKIKSIGSSGQGTGGAGKSVGRPGRRD